MKPICNYCGHLVKNYHGAERRFFDAHCRKKLIENGDVKKPMLIEAQVCSVFDIERPNWCPIYGMGQTQTKKDAEDENTKGEEAPKKVKDMSYYEKKEEFKKIQRRLSWEDIKEGGYYVIPKIMYTPRKILHVVTKTSSCLSCHEISETTGTEYSTYSFVYENDIEASLIVELHNF